MIMYPELRKIGCLETAGEYSMLTKSLVLVFQRFLLH